MTTPAKKSVSPSTHRQFTGVVVRALEAKTVRVVVETMALHPKYRKQYAKRSTFAVHDEDRKAKVGDKVMFEECRPISKTKRWRLLSIVHSA